MSDTPNPLLPLLEPVLAEIQALRAELEKRESLRTSIDMAQVLGLPDQAGYTIKDLEKVFPIESRVWRQLFNDGVLVGTVGYGGKIVIYRWSLLEWMGLPTSRSKLTLTASARKGVQGLGIRPK